MTFRDTVNDYTHTFNMENELVSVSNNGNTTSFAYDAAGIRTKTVAPNGTVTDYPFPGYEVESPTSNPTVRITFSIAGQTIATRVSGDPVSSNNGISYFYNDHLGSNTALRKPDGSRVATYYLPFGNYRGAGPNQTITDRDFTGQPQNRAVGLLYYQARFYVPGLGRFASPDIFVMDPVNPASLNRYSYVGNNPLLYTDSDGHCWPLCTAAIGAVAGAIVGAASVALPQMIQNVRDGQPLTASIDPSQVATAAGIGAVSGAVAGATFGAGMAAGGAIAGAVGISSASGVSATAVGLTTVAVSGVAAGQTGRATANLMTGQSVSQGLFQPGDMALDAATSAVGFRLSGGGFNRIAPSHVAHPGSFARGSIQATGPKATPGQRQAIQELGPCHHCGTSNPGGNGRMIADHIPPNSLANEAQQQLYPQCRSCMGHQADYLRHYSRSPLVRPQRLPFGTLGATLFSPPIDLE